jgi:L-asparagine transporter-like permease
MIYELARRGDAPAIFGRTSENHVPRLGILLGTAGGLVAALASIVSPNGVFLFLIDTSGAIILFIYMLVAFSQIRLRQAMQREGEEPALRMWLFPGLSYAVIACIAAVLVLMAITPGQTSQLALSAVSVAVILGAFAVRRAAGPALA